MNEQLVHFSQTDVDNQSLLIMEKRDKLSSKILTNIVINCIILLIFAITQGFILKVHKDWDSILVFILALTSIIAEGGGLVYVQQMKTKRLLVSILCVIIFELSIVIISFYQFIDEHLTQDKNIQKIVQIIAIVLFILNTLFKSYLFFKLVIVLRSQTKTNIIMDGVRNKKSYEHFTKQLQ